MRECVHPVKSLFPNRVMMMLTIDSSDICEELISKTFYIRSYILLICSSGHSKKANFQHQINCKWKVLILIEI